MKKYINGSMFNSFSRHGEFDQIIINEDIKWNPHEIFLRTRSVGPTTILNPGLAMVGTRMECGSAKERSDVNYIIPVKEVDTIPLEVMKTHECIPMRTVHGVSHLRTNEDDPGKITCFDSLSSKESRYVDSSKEIEPRNAVRNSYNLKEEKELSLDLPSKYETINYEEFMRRVKAVASTLEAVTAKEQETSCWTKLKEILALFLLPEFKSRSKRKESPPLLFWHKSEIEERGTLFNNPINGVDYVIVDAKEFKKLSTKEKLNPSNSQEELNLSNSQEELNPSNSQEQI